MVDVQYLETGRTLYHLQAGRVIVMDIRFEGVDPDDQCLIVKDNSKFQFKVDPKDLYELAKCPFCSSNDLYISTADSGYTVKCKDCSCNSKIIDWSATARSAEGENIFDYGKRKLRGVDLAIASWNKRT